jgi:putative photosynthetic complex assembly protein 2
MTSPLVAMALVLLAWWLSTGLILWRVRVADNAALAGRKPQAHLASVLAGLPVLGLGAWGVAVSGDDASARGVYLGFASALAVWGWIELAFLSGIVTGPNRAITPSGLPLASRLGRALLAIAWHEAALLAALIALALALWPAQNQIALATFALLLGARSLAKINLFLGVPRINLQFIPRPIAHMTSHFRQAPMTGFLPLSIGLLALATGIMGQSALTADLPEITLAYSMLAALAALALLEHLFMVLPLPDAKLWAWMLPKPKHPIKTLEDPHGF